jgi:hypothetical protein
MVKVPPPPVPNPPDRGSKEREAPPMPSWWRLMRDGLRQGASPLRAFRRARRIRRNWGPVATPSAMRTAIYQAPPPSYGRYVGKPSHPVGDRPPTPARRSDLCVTFQDMKEHCRVSTAALPAAVREFRYRDLLISLRSTLSTCQRDTPETLASPARANVLSAQMERITEVLGPVTAEDHAYRATGALPLSLPGAR